MILLPGNGFPEVLASQGMVAIEVGDKDCWSLFLYLKNNAYLLELDNLETPHYAEV